MRVLNVVHYPVFGGPHNQALRLAEPLRERGWETLVLIPDEPGNARERLTQAGVEVEAIPLGRVRTLSNVGANARAITTLPAQVGAIREVIRRHYIGLVQINGLVNPHAAFAARIEGVPIVWQILDTRLPAMATVPSMMLVRTLADAVMTTGTAVAKAHPGGMGLGSRLFPYFPPVDIDLFRPRTESRSDVRRSWGLDDRVPVVGCVANLNPQKGILELVAGFANVRESVRDAVLVLVGAEHATHADYSRKIRAAVAGSGLTTGTDVLFVGPRDDIELQLAGMDVFAFSPVPRGEGVSTVVLEAMSVGLPVVTTAVAGLPEAITSGVDGFLVPPGDPRALAVAVGDLLSDPELMRQIGSAATRKASAKFSTDAAADVHAAAYRFAVGRRS